VVLLVAFTFLLFIFTLVFIYINNSRYIEELHNLSISSETGSRKMRLLSEIAELARARTRLTLQILDIEDVFEQDRLNQQLESYAGRFADVREQLDQLPFSSEDQKLYESALGIIPVILPAQRRAVELMIHENNVKAAQSIMYEIVMPGQQNVIDIFSKLISHEQANIQANTIEVHRSVGEINQDNNYLFATVLFMVTLLSLIVIYRIRVIQKALGRSRETLEEKVIERTTDLQQARDEALKHSKAKSEFLSSMSHELRTPLNAILGFAQVLEMDAVDDMQKESVQEILQAGRHLLELINEVLDLSKIEAGRLTLSMEQIGLSGVQQECAMLTKNLAEHCQVSVNFHEGCDYVVYADYTRIKQVYLNLLSNAIKYNRKQGSVDVSCSIVGEGMLRVSIMDTGPGIAAERQEGLFEPFNRLGAESSDIEGSGIGLIITRRLLEMMGGRIGFDTEVGVGSTFWIEMPYIGESKTTGETTVSDKEESTSQDALQNKPLVLYIEDNPANLRVVERILQQNGRYDLLTAATPSAGLELAVGRHPNVILLDINLPEMDGYEVLARLQSHSDTHSIPVIAVTANAMTDNVQKGREAGFFEYITKPIDIPVLLKTIERALSAT
jgi:signal transduction histidine kinase/ActR/RegA family two-component response regulator